MASMEIRPLPGPREEAHGGVDQPVAGGFVLRGGRVQALGGERGAKPLEPAEVVVDGLA